METTAGMKDNKSPAIISMIFACRAYYNKAIPALKVDVLEWGRLECIACDTLIPLETPKN
jgi:hypothetical protein